MRRQPTSTQSLMMFANTDWYLFNFRLGLAKAYQKQGFHVVLVSPKGPYADKLLEQGFDWRPLEMNTRSMNPLSELKVVRNLYRLVKDVRPLMVHNFTIKPALYGSLVARLVGNVQVINGITGLGHVFTAPGLKSFLVRSIVKLMYRLILSSSKIRVIFQNADDQNVFIKQGMVKAVQASLVRGSGVNCRLFRPGSERRRTRRVRLLFASRLLREKGIVELLEAIDLLSAKDVNCEFLIAGDIYESNPSSLNRDDVQKLSANKWVRYLGHIDNMPKLIAQSDIVILPSYREGTPKILLEAAASGKPIIATDIAGCRGIVQHEQNGYLVPVKEVQPLADAVEKLVLNDKLRTQFGQRSREIAINYFDEDLINEQTIEVLRELNLVCPTISSN